MGSRRDGEDVPIGDSDYEIKDRSRDHSPIVGSETADAGGPSQRSETVHAGGASETVAFSCIVPNTRQHHLDFLLAKRTSGIILRQTTKDLIATVDRVKHICAYHHTALLTTLNELRMEETGEKYPILVLEGFADIDDWDDFEKDFQYKKTVEEARHSLRVWVYMDACTKVTDAMNKLNKTRYYLTYAQSNDMPKTFPRDDEPSENLILMAAKISTWMTQYNNPIILSRHITTLLLALDDLSELYDQMGQRPSPTQPDVCYKELKSVWKKYHKNDSIKKGVYAEWAEAVRAIRDSMRYFIAENLRVEVERAKRDLKEYQARLRRYFPLAFWRPTGVDDVGQEEQKDMDEEEKENDKVQQEENPNEASAAEDADGVSPAVESPSVDSPSPNES